MRRFVEIASILMIAGWSSAASAYTPQWFECKGDITFTPKGGAATKEAVADVYVVDADTKNLFKYSEANKRSAFLGEAKGNAVTWSGSSNDVNFSKWQGQFDLGTNALRIEMSGTDGTRIWDQRCTSTSARPES